ncbi:MAG: uracil-DNA glycosylase [Alphaproteobacteria bacterium]|nr:uracil-DNA glycosylase [Alphaproteobacteria bacterium]
MNGFSGSEPAAAQQDVMLEWARDAGIDEVLEEFPIDRFARSRTPRPRAHPARPQPAAPRAEQAPHTASALADARARAGSAGSLAELREALAGFDGCGLKLTATNLVFGSGTPGAAVMLIGEAPGADEDRTGEPFVGASGRLLTRMLASIGLQRDDVYITNILPWRPPGNRQPNTFEREVCLPFLHRHVELVGPRFMVMLGGTAANTLLKRDGSISRMRGRWYDFRGRGSGDPVPALATFHPSYLLRSPERKAEAWKDMLAIRARLDALG